MNSKIRFALALFLGGIFIIAGGLKVMDPRRFFDDIRNYDLIPWRMATIALAFYLPWMEIIVVIAVVIRSVRMTALIILAAMLLVFILAISQAWMRGLDISCGCFGGNDGKPQYLIWIGRDIGLLAVLLALAVLEWKENRRGSSAA